MPTVSVIVPNYCHAPYLEQRIESILQQTFQDFELILLDDCSTDGSREILERYRNHPKVSGIFYNERNSGSPSNSEKGVVESHGRLRVDRRKRRLFLSLFSGTVRPDSRHPSGLQHSFHQQLYRRFPLPDHTGGGARQISQTQTDPIRQPFLPLPFSLPEEHHLQRRNGTGAAQCAPCGRQLHPIPLLRRLAVLDTDRIGGGNVVYLAEPLNYYRVHDSNTTAESIVTGRKHIETLRILEETFRLIDPPLICRLSIAGKHLLRIRKAAGSHWNEEPYLSVRLAWRERYRHPRMIMFWHKVFKDLPRSFSR